MKRWDTHIKNAIKVNSTEIQNGRIKKKNVLQSFFDLKLVESGDKWNKMTKTHSEYLKRSGKIISGRRARMVNYHES